MFHKKFCIIEHLERSMLCGSTFGAVNLSMWVILSNSNDTISLQPGNQKIQGLQRLLYSFFNHLLIYIHYIHIHTCFSLLGLSKLLPWQFRWSRNDNCFTTAQCELLKPRGHEWADWETAKKWDRMRTLRVSLATVYWVFSCLSRPATVQRRQMLPQFTSEVPRLQLVLRAFNGIFKNVHE